MVTWIEQETVKGESEKALNDDLERIASIVSEPEQDESTFCIRLATGDDDMVLTLQRSDSGRPVREVIAEHSEEVGAASVLLYGGESVEDATFDELDIRDWARLELVVDHKSALLDALGFPDEHLTLLQASMLLHAYVHLLTIKYWQEVLSKPECVCK